MRLNLDFLDSPFYTPEYPHTDFEDVQGERFHGDRIVVDNHKFVRCSFSACNFVYSGGPCALVECEVDYQCGVTLTGAAGKGRALLAQIQKVQVSSPTDD